MPYLWALILKTIVTFKINTLEYSKMQSFCAETKSLNVGPKMLYVSMYGLRLSYLRLVSYLKSPLSNY